jgi:hypothetical protein
MAPYLHCVKDQEGFLYELAKAIRHHRCALLVGLGLALPIEVGNGLTQSHLKELLRRMVQWALEKKILKKQGISNDHDIENDDKSQTEFDALLAAGNLDKAELKLQEYLDADTRRKCINEILLQSQHEVRYIYRLLANIPFRAYLTTGFDEFLENEYKLLDKALPLSKYYQTTLDDALVAYEVEESLIVKLHGDVAEDSPALMLSNRLTKSRQPEAIIYPKQLRELLANLYTLFVGFEKTDPDLEGLKSTVSKKDELKRWLLVPDGHLTEQQAEELFHDYKIITLCYANRLELERFLRKLEEVAATPQQIEVYVSYAPEDNEIRNQLQDHLDVMDYSGLKITWSDGKIGAGQVQKPVIEERLKKAQVILLLVSVSYLKLIKSNLKIEMIRAVERERQGKARVIPIVVRSCEWKGALFGRLTVLPSSKIPIDLAGNRDQILLEVAREIKAAIEEWVEKHQDNCPFKDH